MGLPEQGSEVRSYRFASGMGLQSAGRGLNVDAPRPASIEVRLGGCQQSVEFRRSASLYLYSELIVAIIATALNHRSVNSLRKPTLPPSIGRHLQHSK